MKKNMHAILKTLEKQQKKMGQRNKNYLMQNTQQKKIARDVGKNGLPLESSLPQACSAFIFNGLSFSDNCCSKQDYSHAPQEKGVAMLDSHWFSSCLAQQLQAGSWSFNELLCPKEFDGICVGFAC